jgi:hypothetical protein
LLVHEGAHHAGVPVGFLDPGEVPGPLERADSPGGHVVAVRALPHLVGEPGLLARPEERGTLRGAGQLVALV